MTVQRSVPFFDYPRVFTDDEEALTRIFKDVGSRGAFIMQEDLRDFEAHLCQSRARNEEWNSHLRSLDHHLRRQAAGRVEDLVAAVKAVEPHAAGNRVDGVVAADIFYEHQYPRGAVLVGCKRAAMHGAGLLVNRLVQPLSLIHI